MTARAGPTTDLPLAHGLRLPLCLPPTPAEPDGCGDETYQDRRSDERREDFYYPPPTAENPPQADQTRVPDATSEARVAEEPPAQRHALEAGGHRDQGADAGDQVSDQDRLSPVPVEYRTRPFEVRHEKELVTFEVLDHTPQARLPEPQSDGVQDERSTHSGRRRREQHGDERETSVADQEPEQRQRQLRRNRQVQATRQYENEYADVPERMDYVNDPPYEIGEHTTHRALSSYLLSEQPNYAPCNASPDRRPSAHPRRAANPQTILCKRTDSNDADVRFPPVILPVGCDNGGVLRDFEHRYRVVRGRDIRFDGWFYVAVTSTGIYCRPSCPAVTPKRSHVRFYPTAAAAQYAGFRACKRCRPDAVPGSPEWDTRADIVARTMRLIADGVVDRDGVAGLARRLGYTERHLNRLLSAEVGAGPLALARA